MDVLELLEKLHLKELELRCLNYGSIEVRQKNEYKYIYTHFRVAEETKTKYLGEYSDDLYNQALDDNIKAKELNKLFK